MPRRHIKNKTMKRGGMWSLFDPTSTSTPTSTPSATSSSWWNPFSSNKLSSDGYSSWNPFSSNKPSSSSYSSYGSSSPSQQIQPSTYPPGAPYQEQPDYNQGQTNQDYNQDYSQGQTNQGQTNQGQTNQDYNQGQTDYNEQQNAGYRRKRQTKKSSLIKYRTLRPSLGRTGGKTRKMSRRRKH